MWRLYFKWRGISKLGYSGFMTWPYLMEKIQIFTLRSHSLAYRHNINDKAAYDHAILFKKYRIYGQLCYYLVVWWGTDSESCNKWKIYLIKSSLISMLCCYFVVLLIIYFIKCQTHAYAKGVLEYLFNIKYYCRCGNKANKKQCNYIARCIIKTYPNKYKKHKQK